MAAAGTPYHEWVSAYASYEFGELAQAADDLLDAFSGGGDGDGDGGGGDGDAGGGCKVGGEEEA